MSAESDLKGVVLVSERLEVRIVELQRAGKQPMSAEEFLRGNVLAAGTRLT